MQGLNELQSYCLLKQFAKQAQLDAVQLANISEDQLLEVIVNGNIKQVIRMILNMKSVLLCGNEIERS